MAKPSLTAARLRELLHYNPETGVFQWAQTVGQRAQAGGVAGSLHSTGYVHIIIAGVCHKAHRLAWLHVHGEWPADVIDHRNGIKADNRINNLRSISSGWNTHNQRAAHRNSGTGILGVTRQGNRWRAQIHVAGKLIFLGSFLTPEEAQQRYLQEKQVRHPGALL